MSSASFSPSVPSATVVLLRQGDASLEVLMVRRHRKATFGDTYVFPGGLVERQDHDVNVTPRGGDAANFNDALGADDAHAWLSAAVREVFEEVGVLLARQSGGQWADGDRHADLREPLRTGEEAWPGFLAREKLRLAAENLHYIAHWITPREIDRRFSTRFFVAELPEGATATHCEAELRDACWIAPADALARAASGDPEFRLPRPTRATLKLLLPFSTTADALIWARDRSAGGIEAVRPAVVAVGEENIVVLPGDRRYPDYGAANE